MNLLMTAQRTVTCTHACRNVNGVITELTALPHPDSNVTNYRLVTDSSSYFIRAALHKVVDSMPVSVGFFFKLREKQNR